ncbi:MAG: hypothetical protein HYY51_03345 [Candidatus Magasanikbacteria bacterium]|nr:hypothetical protein [Candidatus Magasanikbacteria bacterium]
MIGLKPKGGFKEGPLTQHQGIFRREINLFEAVALIVSTTIGAGVLGLPFAVAQVGLFLGTLCIVALGFLMMGLNILIGEVSASLNNPLQLPGLAKKYLGKPGEMIMTFVLYVTLFGVLVVYIIGEGETLSALFGGNPFAWSLSFFLVSIVLIFLGIRTVKKTEFFLTFALLVVIIIILLWSLPHVRFFNIKHFDFARLLLPYGVILFAFHGTTAVPEAHSLLLRRKSAFRKAIFISGLITTAVYVLFAFSVVGVTGLETTEIATIGLGNTLGPVMFFFGNIFAALAMGTSFIMVGLSLRDSMNWDFKLGPLISNIFVAMIPLSAFLLGLRGFIEVIDVIGGVFISIEMFIIMLIYIRAKQRGDLGIRGGWLAHSSLFMWIFALALFVGILYSVSKQF